MSFVDLFREQPRISPLTGYGRRLAWSTCNKLAPGVWDHAIVTYDGRTKRARSIVGVSSLYGLTAFDDELLWLEKRDGQTNIRAMSWDGEEVRLVASSPQPVDVAITQCCGQGEHLVLVGETAHDRSVVLSVARRTGQVSPVVSADFPIRQVTLSGTKVVFSTKRRAQLYVAAYDGPASVRTIDTGHEVKALASAGGLVVVAMRDGSLARVDLEQAKLHTFARLDADLYVAALRVVEPYVFVRTGPSVAMIDGLSTGDGPAILRVSLADGSSEPLLEPDAGPTGISSMLTASAELSGPHVADGSMYFASRSRGAVSKVSFAS